MSTIKTKFDEYSSQLGKEKRKRDMKRAEKEKARDARVVGRSIFGVDRESSQKKEVSKLKKDFIEDKCTQKRDFKDPKQDAKECRKFRGKRNSVGAKMIGFKGGDHKNFRRSGGGIGNRDLSGKIR